MNNICKIKEHNKNKIVNCLSENNFWFYSDTELNYYIDKLGGLNIDYVNIILDSVYYVNEIKYIKIKLYIIHDIFTFTSEFDLRIKDI